MRLEIFRVSMAAVFLVAPQVSVGDYVEVIKTANIYRSPTSSSERVIYIEPNSAEEIWKNLNLASPNRENGYYHVALPNGTGFGFVYKTRVRLHSGTWHSGSIPTVMRPLEENAMRAHFIDVGQGDATLLEFQCGAVLIDAGGESNQSFQSNEKLLAYLEWFFENRPDLQNTIDTFFITHPHIDHSRGGTPLLNSQFTVRNFIEGDTRGGSGAAQQRMWRDRAQNDSTIGYEDVDFSEIQDGFANEFIDPVDCTVGPDPKIQILWADLQTDPGWGNEFGKPVFENRNNHSLVLRIDFGEASILLTGDLEHRAIEDLIAKHGPIGLLDVDVYQVGHHGSKNGTTDELVAAMTPKVAIFSHGDPARHLQWTAWQYGHPNEGVIALLENSDHGLTWSRTPVSIQAANGARNFSERYVDAAMYFTGFDGNIVVKALENGRLVITHDR